MDINIKVQFHFFHETKIVSLTNPYTLLQIILVTYHTPVSIKRMSLMRSAKRFQQHNINRHVKISKRYSTTLIDHIFISNL